jgi:hypothetical protein
MCILCSGQHKRSDIITFVSYFLCVYVPTLLSYSSTNEIFCSWIVNIKEILTLDVAGC